MVEGPCTLTPAAPRRESAAPTSRRVSPVHSASPTACVWIPALSSILTARRACSLRGRYSSGEYNNGAPQLHPCPATTLAKSASTSFIDEYRFDGFFLMQVSTIVSNPGCNSSTSHDGGGATLFTWSANKRSVA